MAVAGAVKLGWIKQSRDGMFAKDQVQYHCVMAHIVMTYIVMAYIVMAYIVMV